MLFRRKSRDSREDDLDRELRNHFDLEAEEHGPQAARRALGSPALVRELVREAWGWASLERLAHDLRYALRMMRKSPTFTLTAILSLALGIGANTAIFTLLDAVLLRDLPVRAPQDLVLLTESARGRQVVAFSSARYRILQSNSTLEGLAAFRPWSGFRVTLGNASHLASGQLVTPDYFSLLGVPAILGRTLTAADENSQVAVLSYAYWRAHFLADPNILGRTLAIQGQPFTIIGVSPPAFTGLEPGKAVEITVPLSMQPIVMPGTPLATIPGARWLRLIGRRKPGVSTAQVQAELGAMWDRVAQRNDGRLEIVSGAQGLFDMRRQFSLPLRVLMGVVALVLLVACANLASLLLARATARRHEIRIRAAIGASRLRLMRQLLTETLLLSAIGGACGLALARLGAQGLVQAMSRGRSLIALDLTLHWQTVAFTAGIAIVTAILFGIGPALSATAPPEAQGRIASAAPRRWTAALIVSQVALCLVILIAAGLMLGTVRNLARVDAGFRQDHIVLMSIRPSISGYSGRRMDDLYAELHRRFSALPGVQSATLSMSSPLGGASVTMGASAPGAAGIPVNVNYVGPRFFETFGIPLLAGREFNAQDDEHRPSIAVVTQSVARALYPNQSPLGQRLEMSGGPFEIVGVAKDTLYQSLRAAAQPTVYRSYMQTDEAQREELAFGVRTAGDPALITDFLRRELRETARDVPVYSLTTLDAQVDATLVQERMLSMLATAFGALALLLAAIGLYGRLSYAVAERTREIGVRMALGAQPGGIVWMILRDVLLFVAMGVAVGLPLALTAAGAIRGLLFGLQPADPVILAAVVAATFTVTILAAWPPARRAARLDPMSALK